MDKLNPKITKRKAEPKGRDFYYNPSTNEMELVSDPSPLRPTNPKADPTAGSKYVTKEQRIYETIKLPGYETAAKADRSFAKLEAERDKQDAQEVIRKAYKRDSITRDEIKYLKPKSSEIKKAPTYFPTNERMPETPPPNFEKPVDLDLFKGLGSLIGTTRKDYQKID